MIKPGLDHEITVGYNFIGLVKRQLKYNYSGAQGTKILEDVPISCFSLVYLLECRHT